MNRKQAFDLSEMVVYAVCKKLESWFFNAFFFHFQLNNRVGISDTTALTFKVHL